MPHPCSTTTPFRRRRSTCSLRPRTARRARTAAPRWQLCLQTRSAPMVRGCAPPAVGAHAAGRCRGRRRVTPQSNSAPPPHPADCELAVDLYNKGFEIAHHTWHHKQVKDVPQSELEAEIAQGRRLLAKCGIPERCGRAALAAGQGRPLGLRTGVVAHPPIWIARPRDGPLPLPATLPAPLQRHRRLPRALPGHRPARAPCAVGEQVPVREVGRAKAARLAHAVLEGAGQGLFWGAAALRRAAAARRLSSPGALHHLPSLVCCSSLVEEVTGASLSRGVDQRVWPFDMADGVKMNCGWCAGGGGGAPWCLPVSRSRCRPTSRHAACPPPCTLSSLPYLHGCPPPARPAGLRASSPAPAPSAGRACSRSPCGTCAGRTTASSRACGPW